ncbi:DUF4192 family protein [Arthrobacter sp. NA-172]|uniref:DUF4192 family protein n=1 Tax=Arthrobacter sp. NA-172 TaxID=3367524 RepID=UPI00375534E4
MTPENSVTISRPEDILGFIPHALGLWPTESLVAITMHGKTLGATLRVDLPPERSEDMLALYSGRISEYLERGRRRRRGALGLIQRRRLGGRRRGAKQPAVVD